MDAGFPVRLSEIRDLLECDVLCGEDRLDLEIEECFAADLMSDVLAYCRPNALLLTGLTGVQSVHTADVAELAAVVYVNRKRPAGHILDIAREKEIPLLSTPRTLYEACGILRASGFAGGSRTR